MQKPGKNRVLYLFTSCILLLVLVLTAGCNAITGNENSPGVTGNEDNPPVTGGNITPYQPVRTSHGTNDDWEFSAEKMMEAMRSAGGSYSMTVVPGTTMVAPVPTMTNITAGVPNMGFSTGGAKDIDNFRENIANGFLPIPSDVTYEGMFYDYYFDTGITEPQDKLFYPSYSTAVSRDPFSGEVEYYLSVGLNSGMKEADFQRKKLNLVIVLDISGSMSSPFNSYYYDRFGRVTTLPTEELGKSKIDVAKESVVALLDHLGDEDNFGMVLFNDFAYLAKPLNPVSETDMDAIAGHIMEITADGSTNLDDGMQKATALFEDLGGVNADEYENRIIFLTDAMPNQGDFSGEGLLGMTKANSLDRLYSTFIGIGVDFNTELVEIITKIRGANYYSVHSSAEFKQRMDDEFEYMVTPLVFNLQLNLEAAGWVIEEVYGSPEASEATGQLMKVNTLFPSKTEGGETRGGLVLLKLRKTGGEDNRLVLKVSYEDRSGNTDSSEASIVLAENEPEYFANSGIRKGVLLSRYADLLKNWMIDERDHAHLSRPWEPRISEDTGIILPPPFPELNEWERQSLPLMVSDAYRELFDDFLDYFKTEAAAIGDIDLGREIDVLETLIQH